MVEATAQLHLHPSFIFYGGFSLSLSPMLTLIFIHKFRKKNKFSGCARCGVEVRQSLFCLQVLYCAKSVLPLLFDLMALFFFLFSDC